jgi:hypothetical protein
MAALFSGNLWVDLAAYLMRGGSVGKPDVRP